MTAISPTPTDLPIQPPTPSRSLLNSFRMAAWLGWQIESNWADPFLFAIYSLIKPLASAAILVVMYSVITGANFESPVFPYIYLGNAFYTYVGAVMTGMSWTIIDDREHYKTLKYMYIAPINVPIYLAGRGVAKFLVASISVLVTILFGVAFLHLHINILEVDWGLFLVALLVGVLMLATMGLMLAGLNLLVAHHYGAWGEAVAGALYLFSGAIFPLEVLPTWLRPAGFIMPVTYWLELIRRALVGSVAQAFPTLSGFTNLQLLGILAGLTLLFGLASVYAFRWCEHRARENGMIDMVTNY
jgi:ABC-2 type transport system permease protein